MAVINPADELTAPLEVVSAVVRDRHGRRISPPARSRRWNSKAGVSQDALRSLGPEMLGFADAIPVRGGLGRGECRCFSRSPDCRGAREAQAQESSPMAIDILRRQSLDPQIVANVADAT